MTTICQNMAIQILEMVVSDYGTTFNLCPCSYHSLPCLSCLAPARYQPLPQITKKILIGLTSGH
jgi:hypothetical protein